MPLSSWVPRVITNNFIAKHRNEQSRITNKALDLKSSNREALHRQFDKINKSLPAGEKSQRYKWIKKQEQIFFQAMSQAHRPRVIRNYTDLARVELGIPEPMTRAERRAEREQQERDMADILAQREADIEAHMQRERQLQREAQLAHFITRHQHISSLLQHGHAENPRAALRMIHGETGSPGRGLRNTKPKKTKPKKTQQKKYKRKKTQKIAKTRQKTRRKLYRN